MSVPSTSVSNTAISRTDVSRTAVSRTGISRTTTDRATTTARLLAAAQQAEPEEQSRLRQEVVLLHLDVAESLAHRYRQRGEDHSDLVQAARVALIEAARRFDPERGDFLAFAIPTILGSLKRHFRDHGWMVRPPRRIQDLQTDINRAWPRLSQDLGHAPSNQEMADHLGTGVGAVAEARAAHGCFHAASLDAPYGDSESTLAGTLAADESGYELVEAITVLGPPCRDLSATDQRLLHLRFVEQRTQREIAEEFGVSQMQISRSLTRILTTLRRVVAEPAADVRPQATAG